MDMAAEESTERPALRVGWQVSVDKGASFGHVLSVADGVVEVLDTRTDEVHVLPIGRVASAREDQWSHWARPSFPGTLSEAARGHAARLLSEGVSIEIGSVSLHPDEDDDLIWGCDAYGQDAVAGRSHADISGALAWAAGQNAPDFVHWSEAGLCAYDGRDDWDEPPPEDYYDGCDDYDADDTWLYALDDACVRVTDRAALACERILASVGLEYDPAPEDTADMLSDPQRLLDSSPEDYWLDIVSAVEWRAPLLNHQAAHLLAWAQIARAADLGDTAPDEFWERAAQEVDQAGAQVRHALLRDEDAARLLELATLARVTAVEARRLAAEIDEADADIERNGTVPRHELAAALEFLEAENRPPMRGATMVARLLSPLSKFLWRVPSAAPRHRPVLIWARDASEPALACLERGGEDDGVYRGRDVWIGEGGRYWPISAVVAWMPVRKPAAAFFRDPAEDYRQRCEGSPGL
jgi:hypothetical protein